MDPVRLAFEWGSEEQCLRLLERLRWPSGIRCPWCDSTSVSRFTVKEGVRRNRVSKSGAAVAIPLRRLYDCLNHGCRHQFSVTSGTVMHNSRVPVWKWMVAIALQIEAHGALGARELQAELSVSYKTAWSMTHRIRLAMEDCGLLESGYDPRRKPMATERTPSSPQVLQRVS